MEICSFLVIKYIPLRLNVSKNELKAQFFMRYSAIC